MASEPASLHAGDLRLYAEAAPGWTQALERLGLVDLPPPRPSAFGSAFLNLLRQSGFEVEPYCRGLVERLDRVHRDQDFALISWGLTARSILASLPSESILRLYSSWKALLGHPFFPLRRFAVEMIARGPADRRPSLEEVLTKLRLEKGVDEFNLTKDLLRIARQDSGATAYLAAAYPAATGVLRKLIEALVSGLGSDAIALLSIAEADWRAQIDPVERAYKLRTLASVASGADERKKREVFEAIVEALALDEWRVHTCCYESLGLLKYDAESSVKILAHALETEESAYDGLPHLSIVRAMKAFGHKAAPHAAALAHHLLDESWEVNNIGERAILDALEAMGPEARAAAPEVRLWLEDHADEVQESRTGEDASWLSVYRKAERLMKAWKSASSAADKT